MRIAFAGAFYNIPNKKHGFASCGRSCCQSQSGRPLHRQQQARAAAGGSQRAADSGPQQQQQQQQQPAAGGSKQQAAASRSMQRQQQPATAGRQAATLLPSGSGGTLKSRPGEKQHGEELRGSCFFHLFSAGNAYILSSVGVITPTCTCGSLIEWWGWEANCPWFSWTLELARVGINKGSLVSCPTARSARL